MSSKPIIQKTAKMRLFFYATPLSKGASSEKTSIDWNAKGEGQQVRSLHVHKVDNSG